MQKKLELTNAEVRNKELEKNDHFVALDEIMATRAIWLQAAERNL